MFPITITLILNTRLRRVETLTKRIKKDYKPIKEAKPANVSLVNEVRKLYDENPPREPPRPNFKNYNSFY